MKTLLTLILCLLTAVNSYAQKDTTGLNMPFSNGKLIYTEVVNASSLNKLDLYKNGKQWFVDTFKSPRNVIQSEDKEDGLIVGKGMVYVSYKSMIGVNNLENSFSIKLECKDGKYRYSFYDMSIEHESLGTLYPSTLVDGIVGNPMHGQQTFTKKISRQILESIDFETKIMIQSLKTAMNKKLNDF